MLWIYHKGKTHLRTKGENKEYYNMVNGERTGLSNEKEKEGKNCKHMTDMTEMQVRSTKSTANNPAKGIT